MKKIITLIASIILLISMSACTTADTSLKDGTYKASYNSPDDHGWTEYVEITVSGEKITAVTFDAVDENGNKKSADASYREAMENAGSNTYPEKFYSELATELVAKQNIDDIDGVAGATVSTDSFKKLVKELQGDMKSGNTTEKKVNQ